MPLMTRNVFVDTQTFERLQFAFTSTKLRAFREACEEEEFSFLTTTIVVREVRSHVESSIKASLNHLKEFRKKAGILSHDSGLAPLFEVIDEATAISNAHEVFEKFLSDANATVLDPGTLPAGSVIDDYFDHAAPFSEKKKSEFPDAFNMLALREHLGPEDRVYIVSEDKDLVSCCDANPRFLHMDRLEKLLDLFNQHDAQRSAFVRKYLDEHSASIKTRISAQVEAEGAFNSSTWDDSWVEEFSVDEVHDLDTSILYLDDTTCHISVDTTFDYSVTVKGPDTMNGYWDGEDKRMYAFGEVSREASGTAELYAEIEVVFAVEGEGFVFIKDGIAVMSALGGTEVCVDEWEPDEHY